MNNSSQVKRIVVKVGTSTLTYETGKVNLRRMEKIARVLSDLANSGIEIALVSSGAIGIGAGKLGLKERPSDTPGRQAAATVGQCELMFMYDKLFGEYGQITGQLLITRSDFENGERRDNLYNAFNKLFEYGALPIINENDCVGVEEIVFGDNDNLSAHVAKITGADLLIILSDIDGLFTSNPREDENAKFIPVVEERHIAERIKKNKRMINAGIGCGIIRQNLYTDEGSVQSKPYPSSKISIPNIKSVLFGIISIFFFITSLQ